MPPKKASTAKGGRPSKAAKRKDTPAVILPRNNLRASTVPVSPTKTASTPKRTATARRINSPTPSPVTSPSTHSPSRESVSATSSPTRSPVGRKSTRPPASVQKSGPGKRTTMARNNNEVGPKDTRVKESTGGDKRKSAKVAPKEKRGKESTGGDKRKSIPAKSKEASKTPQEKNRQSAGKKIDSPEFRKRYRPPNRILREVQYYQKSTNCLIPLAPFCKLVKEIATDVSNCPDLRFKSGALRALQEAAENYVVGLFEDSYLITLHARRVTMYPKDLRLAYKIRGDMGRY